MPRKKRRTSYWRMMPKNADPDKKWCKRRVSEECKDKQQPTKFYYSSVINKLSPTCEYCLRYIVEWGEQSLAGRRARGRHIDRDTLWSMTQAKRLLERAARGRQLKMSPKEIRRLMSG